MRLIELPLLLLLLQWLVLPFFSGVRNVASRELTIICLGARGRRTLCFYTRIGGRADSNTHPPPPLIPSLQVERKKREAEALKRQKEEEEQWGKANEQRKADGKEEQTLEDWRKEKKGMYL